MVKTHPSLKSSLLSSPSDTARGSSGPWCLPLPWGRAAVVPVGWQDSPAAPSSSPPPSSSPASPAIPGGWGGFTLGCGAEAKS